VRLERGVGGNQVAMDETGGDGDLGRRLETLQLVQGPRSGRREEHIFPADFVARCIEAVDDP
jgi:hypothetical protein